MTAAVELRAGPLGRHHALPVLALAVCNVVAFAALLIRGSNSAAGLVAGTVIAAAVLPVLWWWGARVATVVRIDDDRITWASPLRRGGADLADLTVVRRARLGLGHVVIETAREHGTVVLGGRHAGSFFRVLEARAPHVDISNAVLGDSDPEPRFRFDGSGGDAGR